MLTFEPVRKLFRNGNNNFLNYSKYEFSNFSASTELITLTVRMPENQWKKKEYFKKITPSIQVWSSQIKTFFKKYTIWME